MMEFFRNTKVKTKLLLSFGVIVLMLALSMIGTVVGLSEFYKAVKFIVMEGVPVIAKVIEGKEALNGSEILLYKAILADSGQKKEEYIAHILDNDQKISTLLDSLKLTGDNSFIGEYRLSVSEAFDAKTQIVTLIQESKETEAIALMNETYIPKQEKAEGVLSGAMQDIQRVIEKYVLTISSGIKTIIMVFCILVVLGILFALWVCFAITKSIVDPLEQIKQVAYEMEQGNLSTRVEYTSKNELGQVCQSMNNTARQLNAYIYEIDTILTEMAQGNLDIHLSTDFKGDFVHLRNSIMEYAESLNHSIGSINQISEQVASGSDQIANGSQALSQGADEQTGSIEELSATIFDISEKINQNADFATQADEAAQRTAAEIKSGSEQMGNMMEAMKHISNTSDHIGKIIKTIDDIAFQTNILALNAAVEAARAGQSGKGFSVVADEVRNLAAKSAEAAKDTTALIQNSIRAVEEGSKIASSTARSLAQIVSEAENITTAINIISRSTKEQAAAAIRITGATHQISAVVQTNSATAQESAAASEELSGQAQMLRALVGRFRLKDAGKMAGMYTGR